MNEYRYILKPYQGPSSRHTCPGCGSKRKFSRYIDRTSGGELADHVGRCDRENSCGYHFAPKQFFEETGKSITITEQIANVSKMFPEKQTGNTPVDYLPFDVFDKSMARVEKCDLFPFLERLFRREPAKLLCENYFIGANKDGFTCFWQVDVEGLIRQVKLMRYAKNGHRIKAWGARFAGKGILNNLEANLQQCFFGEYLLSIDGNKEKPVAIVESEKTAAICSLYFPQYVWLATGGKYGANWTSQNVCKVLKGKKVVLYPDLGAFDSWKKRGELLAKVAGCKVVTSDVLEKEATEQDKIEGLDLADYLLKVQDGSGLALTDRMFPVIMMEANIDYAI